MKKLALTIAIVLSMGIGASAQNSLLGKESYDEDFMDRTDATTPLILPGFGSEDDEDAPLGTGIAIMTALGAAYLVGKKRKEA